MHMQMCTAIAFLKQKNNDAHKHPTVAHLSDLLFFEIA